MENINKSDGFVCLSENPQKQVKMSSAVESVDWDSYKDEYFNQIPDFKMSDPMQGDKKFYRIKSNTVLHMSSQFLNFHLHYQGFEVDEGVDCELYINETKESQGVLISFLQVKLGQGSKFKIYGNYLKNKGESRLYLKVNQEKESSFGYHIVSGGEKYFTAKLNCQMGKKASLEGTHVGVSSPSYESRFESYVYHNDEAVMSDQVFREVVKDKSSTSVQTRVIIDNKAQRSESNQDCKVLLLGNKSKGEALPELEVYADDVKCSHGATLGEMEETTKHYIQSRGIDEETTKKILLESFLGEAFCLTLNKNWVKQLKKQLRSMVIEQGFENG